METPNESQVTAADVLEFWRNAGPEKWFAKDESFDAAFRERFLAAHEAAARGELEAWTTDADGALAVILLLDQFPRNVFRGEPRMYATDELARRHADEALREGLDLQMPEELRPFFYLPYSHSESLVDQERAVELQTSPEFAEHARGHCEIVRRFGRFPHRNAVMGRETTPEEAAFLKEGGFGG